MNSEQDDPPFSDLEKDLGKFQRAPLPGDWKAGMIDNALAQSAPPPARDDAKIVRFSRFQKISLSGIAACWAAIALLRLTMPAEPEPKGQPAVAEAAVAVPTPADLPLLVRYIEDRNALTRLY